MVILNNDSTLTALDLNVVEGEVVDDTQQIVETDQTSNMFDKDFQTARTNLLDIIKQGKQSFEELSTIATLSQRPSSYETLALLLKTIVDANKDLVALHDKIKEEAARNSNGSITNNNVFVGNASELLRLVKDIKSQ